MTRFQFSVIAALLASGWWLSQLATSFPLIRVGCLIVILGGFLWIGLDALDDRAKTRMQENYCDLIDIVTPHIRVAIGLLFLVFVGIYVGW
jgi:hypothetical protein